MGDKVDKRNLKLQSMVHILFDDDGVIEYGLQVQNYGVTPFECAGEIFDPSVGIRAYKRIQCHVSVATTNGGKRYSRSDSMSPDPCKPERGCPSPPSKPQSF